MILAGSGGLPFRTLCQPALIRAFRTESSRTLLALKAYAGTLAGS